MVWAANHQCICQRISELFFGIDGVCLILFYQLAFPCVIWSKLQHSQITSYVVHYHAIEIRCWLNHCLSPHTLALVVMLLLNSLQLLLCMHQFISCLMLSR